MHVFLMNHINYLIIIYIDDFMSCHIHDLMLSFSFSFLFFFMQDFCDFMQEMLSMMNNVKDEVLFIFYFLN